MSKFQGLKNELVRPGANGYRMIGELSGTNEQQDAYLDTS
jgi:hypothetical protein